MAASHDVGFRVHVTPRAVRKSKVASPVTGHSRAMRSRRCRASRHCLYYAARDHIFSPSPRHLVVSSRSAFDLSQKRPAASFPSIS